MLLTLFQNNLRALPISAVIASTWTPSTSAAAAETFVGFTRSRTRPSTQTFVDESFGAISDSIWTPSVSIFAVNIGSSVSGTFASNWIPSTSVTANWVIPPIYRGAGIGWDRVAVSAVANDEVAVLTITGDEA